MPLLLTFVTAILFTLFITIFGLFLSIFSLANLILIRSRKYKEISKKLIKRYYFTINITKSYHYFFNPRLFNKWFDNFYQYNDILKTKDNELITIINYQRRLTRIAGILWYIIAFIIISIAIMTLILFFIAMIINGVNAF